VNRSEFEGFQQRITAVWPFVDKWDEHRWNGYWDELDVYPGQIVAEALDSYVRSGQKFPPNVSVMLNECNKLARRNQGLYAVPALPADQCSHGHTGILADGRDVIVGNSPHVTHTRLVWCLDCESEQWVDPAVVRAISETPRWKNIGDNFWPDRTKRR
jgi:hypothetical protein